jgi:hypothetical protein
MHLDNSKAGQENAMSFTYQGPKITPGSMADAERVLGRSIPNEAKWLLSNVANGGWPEREHLIRIDPPVKFRMVHALFGIDHPDENFDLVTRLQIPTFPWDHVAFPLGYDDWDGQYLLMLAGPRQGEVHFSPYEEYFYDRATKETHFVASDIFNFADILNQKSLSNREPEKRTARGRVWCIPGWETWKYSAEVEEEMPIEHGSDLLQPAHLHQLVGGKRLYDIECELAEAFRQAERERRNR